MEPLSTLEVGGSRKEICFWFVDLVNFILQQQAARARKDKLVKNNWSLFLLVTFKTGHFFWPLLKLVKIIGHFCLVTFIKTVGDPGVHNWGDSESKESSQEEQSQAT